MYLLERTKVTEPEPLDNCLVPRIIRSLKKGKVPNVPKVQINENEPLEKALKKLKKKIEREGILKVLKARKHYEKPSEKRRRKMRAAQKRKPF